jgi:hypothetical protein
VVIKTERNLKLLFSLLTVTLGVLIFQNLCLELAAQLEIPEAEPIGNVGPNVANASGYLTFEDLGYKIEYPDDWEVVAPGVLYGLSAIQAPDGSVLTIKFIPADDAYVDNIADLAELFQEEGSTQVAEFYRNSTTLLGGLPAFILTGIYTYTPTVFEALEVQW